MSGLTHIDLDFYHSLRAGIGIALALMDHIEGSSCEECADRRRLQRDVKQREPIEIGPCECGD